VVQQVLDRPVAADPGSELGAGGWVPSPADDLEGLLRVGVVDVVEGGRLEPADLLAVVGAGALVVVEGDLAPGQTADAVEEAGVVGLDVGDVVGAALALLGAVGVLGVQGVGGDHRVGQVEGVQQRGEGGDLVALVGDLALEPSVRIDRNWSALHSSLELLFS
jgi:hypothetical protein